MYEIKLNREQFKDCFAMLLSYCGKPDPEGRLFDVYFNSLSQLSFEQVGGAVYEWMDSSTRLPTPADLKSIVLRSQRGEMKQLSAAAEPSRPTPKEASQGVLIMLAEIFLGQGETDFYRDALSMRNGNYLAAIAGAVGQKKPLTHEDVMNFIIDSDYKPHGSKTA